MADDARSPDRRHRIGSEREAFALVEQATAYGAAHPQTFAGAWLDYIDDFVYVFAAFVGDVEVHRTALDPRVQLVPGTRPRAELEATAAQVRAFVEGYPVESHSLHVDVEEARLVLSATVVDDAAFETAVRERFGSVVDLYVSVRGWSPTTIEDWRVLSDGRTIEAAWIGGNRETDHRLEAVERDGEIHLTASSFGEIGLRRAPGGDGPPINWGSTLEGYQRTARVTLDEPVGKRRILDDQRDRMDDLPRVKRPREQRRMEEMLGLEVLDWIETLDWADGQGCEGPGENGWIRIYATVDDTERLRAAIVEQFGPGFVVAYQAPDEDDEDEHAEG